MSRSTVVGMICVVLLACGQDQLQVVQYDPATDTRLKLVIDVTSNITSADNIILRGSVTGGEGRLTFIGLNMNQGEEEEFSAQADGERWHSSEILLGQEENLLQVKVTDATGRTAEATVVINSTAPLHFVDIRVYRDLEREKRLPPPYDLIYVVNFQLNARVTVHYWTWQYGIDGSPFWFDMGEEALDQKKHQNGTAYISGSWHRLRIVAKGKNGEVVEETVGF